jgi:hypothetical protein
LRGRMPPGAASHAGVDFQPQPSMRRRFVGPGRSQKESAPDEHRWPGVARSLRPIDGWLVTQLRRKLGEAKEQPRGIAGIIEERADAAVFLDDSLRIFVRELGDQVVFAIRRRMEKKGEQTISLQPGAIFTLCLAERTQGRISRLIDVEKRVQSLGLETVGVTGDLIGQ